MLEEKLWREGEEIAKKEYFRSLEEEEQKGNKGQSLQEYNLTVYESDTENKEDVLEDKLTKKVKQMIKKKLFRRWKRKSRTARGASFPRNTA